MLLRNARRVTQNALIRPTFEKIPAFVGITGISVSLRSFGNCSMRCSNSCTAQASLSTGSRSRLLPAVVHLRGEFVMDGYWGGGVAIDVSKLPMQEVVWMP